MEKKNSFSDFFLKLHRLTISACFSSVFTISDPIEQYDVTATDVCRFSTHYPFYFHIALVALLVVWFIGQVDLNIFGYLNFKAYNFIKNLFISLFGYNHQLLLPYFYYLFLFILFNNVIGMLPWSFTATAQLWVVFFFSITSLGGITLLSIEQKGWQFLDIFYPTAPKIMVPFLIIIEVVSYLIRYISLAVRLFANMVAGHALLKILLLFLVTVTSSFSTFAVLGGVIGFVLIMFVTVLEILIAFLQAYVFIFLMLIYTRELLS